MQVGPSVHACFLMTHGGFQAGLRVCCAGTQQAASCTAGGSACHDIHQPLTLGPSRFPGMCRLSPELAAWLGKETASRPEVTKAFWAYCKEHGLQDPSDKSFILADDTLKALTGEERFKGFSFSKHIKDHFLGYAD